ncbi:MULTISPECIES: P-type conjugative transfer protein VirB9 [Photobacterium]|uniref:P-type conjugative transfer protein VirB9 n=1 Tax=Photobacterium carnosum TaxID=2023717 RepID=A0A2N4UMM7_9GAMM|nr:MULTISPECIES: P-type conjugative transfer protein VirB9 [Photobacterium]KAE8175739.1 P-type conjugative transfer protein VirB9 [Photobacterium carnosum]MBY3790393.1 P-type conjugative transfer protein VirB9 [Photobacterium carnosum]MCD9481323.1 P-type conjugative transfer protein VirB9 [Photobacterium phosphoreum]MCD9485402.1 P-type conjugative transfer protein VirB9 [Photobacterium phosphoreum]MCD9513000.1 P-type conjugative transfer protein VirB9 [Photobacterium phosphoreum]
MKPNKILILLFSACISAPTFALSIPDHSSVSHHMQTVNYNANNVVQVTAYRGRVTEITFSADEKVEQVVTGFSEGWEIIPHGNRVYLKARSIEGETITTSTDTNGQVQTQKNSVTVQPTPNRWHTNLLVNTNLHSYAFNLKLGWGKSGFRQSTYQLVFQYPQQIAALQLAQRKAQQEKEKQALALKTIANTHLSSMNPNYTMQIGENSRDIAPIQAYDNGRFTYFTFAPNSPIPAIFTETGTGQEELVNQVVNPQHPSTVIVHRVAKQWVLRLGQEVVGIHNKAYGVLTVNQHSGTSLPNTVRVMK